MGRALTRGGNAAKAQRRGFAALGLDLNKVAKAMQRDAAGTTLKVMERIGQLPKHLQARVMTDVFGEEARAIAPLLGRLDILKKALGLVSNEQDYAGSVASEFARRAATAEHSLTMLASQLREVALALNGSILPAIKAMTGALGPVALKVSAFVEANARMITIAGAAAAGLVALKVAALGLSFVALMGKGWLLSAALGLLKFTAGAAKAAGGAIALQRALGAMSGQRLSFFQTLTTGIGGLLRAIPGLGFVTSAFGAAAAIISGPVIAAVAGLVAGGFAIWKYWDEISTVVSAAAGALGDRLAPALGFAQPALEAIQPVLSALGELAEIAENLHRREIDALERNELMDQWRRLREDRKVHSAQLGPNEKSVREDGRGHRQPGGIRKAARDLGVSRQTLERATKVASLSPEAKTAARAVGLANNQTALLKAAKHSEPAKQVAALQSHVKTRPPAPKPDPLAEFKAAWTPPVIREPSARRSLLGG